MVFRPEKCGGKKSPRTMFNREVKGKASLLSFKTKESPFCFSPLIPSLSCWGSFSLVLLGWLRAARRGLWWDLYVGRCRSPAALGGGGSGLFVGRDGGGADVWGWPRLETQGNNTAAASLWSSAMRGEKNASRRGKLHTPTRPQRIQLGFYTHV